MSGQRVRLAELLAGGLAGHLGYSATLDAGLYGALSASVYSGNRPEATHSSD